MESELTVWQRLAAPLDKGSIKTRKQGYKDKKTGEYKEFSVTYIDARTVIERLNDVVPGEWHFETELISMPCQASNGKWVLKGRLTVCGCVHEDFGMNDQEDAFDPPKAAVSDALKRCAVHFGIGLELYPGHGDNSAASNGKQTTQKGSQKPPVPASASEQAGNGSSQGEASEWPERPWNLETVHRFFDATYAAQPDEKKSTPMTTEGHKTLGMKVTGLFPDTASRKIFQFMMLGTDSIADFTAAQGNTMLAWGKDQAHAKHEVQDIIASPEFAAIAVAMAKPA